MDTDEIFVIISQGIDNKYFGIMVTCYSGL